MNADQVFRRVLAYREGRALPLGSTLHFPIARDEDMLLLAFVKMGGETMPWGIALGTPAGGLAPRNTPWPPLSER